MTSDELKQSISMREIVEQYGFHPNRAGFISCPFHSGDRTPSMKIYSKDYHCHACGANGDIFSFVMKMDNVDFKTAFKVLGGTYQDTTEYKHKKFRYHMQKQKETQRIRMQRKEEEKRKIIQEIKLLKIFVKLFPVFSDDWCASMNRLEYLFYRLELLTEKR